MAYKTNRRKGELFRSALNHSSVTIPLTPRLKSRAKVGTRRANPNVSEKKFVSLYNKISGSSNLA